jgi:hypothetical protein
MRFALWRLALLGFCCPAIFADQTLSAFEAAQRTGQRATVCGVVASARFSQRSRGEPTFLNFDNPYPDQDFTVLL